MRRPVGSALASALATALALALAAPATLSCKAAPAAEVAPAAVATLDAGHQPLRGRFDAEAGAPRLLVLTSPT